jgi:hypothetical protein
VISTCQQHHCAHKPGSSQKQFLAAAFPALLFLQDGLPLPKFLGPYVPPENLTLASLRSVADKKHGDFAAVISAATIRLEAATGTWTTAIGAAFLGPYNLSDEHSTFSANGTKGPIHQAAAGLGIPIYYYQAAVDRQATDKQPRCVV